MNIYKDIKDRFCHHNPTEDMLKVVYGLDSGTDYQAIIVAPSWKPEKIFKNYDALIAVLNVGPYYCGYEVTVGQHKYGYIQTASGAGNMIDCCLILGAAKCSHIFFIGAVGALVNDIHIGDIVTTKYSIAGDGGSLYLYDNISVDNFRKKVFPAPKSVSRIKQAASACNIDISERTVYCTDSIFCEYYHLDDILSLGSELIEMETASFIRCMDLIQKDYSILLCVSDNSACGNALVGRSEEDSKKFYMAREKYIPELIMALS